MLGRSLGEKYHANVGIMSWARLMWRDAGCDHLFPRLGQSFFRRVHIVILCTSPSSETCIDASKSEDHHELQKFKLRLAQQIHEWTSKVLRNLWTFRRRARVVALTGSQLCADYAAVCRPSNAVAPWKWDIHDGHPCDKIWLWDNRCCCCCCFVVAAVVLAVRLGRFMQSCFLQKALSLDSWISLNWPCDFSDYRNGIISRWHSVQQQMSVLGNAPTQLQAVYVVYDSGGKVLCGVARVVSREGVPGTNVWRF